MGLFEERKATSSEAGLDWACECVHTTVLCTALPQCSCSRLVPLCGSEANQGYESHLLAMCNARQRSAQRAVTMSRHACLQHRSEIGQAYSHTLTASL